MRGSGVKAYLDADPADLMQQIRAAGRVPLYMDGVFTARYFGWKPSTKAMDYNLVAATCQNRGKIAALLIKWWSYARRTG